MIHTNFETNIYELRSQYRALKPIYMSFDSPYRSCGANIYELRNARAMIRGRFSGVRICQLSHTRPLTQHNPPQRPMTRASGEKQPPPRGDNSRAVIHAIFETKRLVGGGKPPAMMQVRGMVRIRLIWAAISEAWNTRGAEQSRHHGAINSRLRYSDITSRGRFLAAIIPAPRYVHAVIRDRRLGVITADQRLARAMMRGHLAGGIIF